VDFGAAAGWSVVLDFETAQNNEWQSFECVEPVKCRHVVVQLVSKHGSTYMEVADIDFFVFV
jgi:hypothetical protein